MSLPIVKRTSAFCCVCTRSGPLVCGSEICSQALVAYQPCRICCLRCWPAGPVAAAHLAAGTQTLSGAAISELDTSVRIFTRCRPGFFFGVARKTR